jgi:hypothetical protein
VIWAIGTIADALRFIPQAAFLPPIRAAGMVGASVLVMGVCVGVGLWAARRVGLGAPFLEAALEGQSVAGRLKAILPLSAGLGAGAAVAVMGLNLLLFKPMFLGKYGPGAARLFSARSQPPAWQGILASLHGGIVEEIGFRLFLVSLLVWIGARVAANPDGSPRRWVFGAAIVGAAVAFGLAHVPNATAFVPFSALLLARALVLNGIAGVVLGWLYWRRGLEAAVIAHFTADIVVHVLFVLALN